MTKCQYVTLWEWERPENTLKWVVCLLIAKYSQIILDFPHSNPTFFICPLLNFSPRSSLISSNRGRTAEDLYEKSRRTHFGVRHQSPADLANSFPRQKVFIKDTRQSGQTRERRGERRRRRLETGWRSFFYKKSFLSYCVLRFSGFLMVVHSFLYMASNVCCSPPVCVHSQGYSFIYLCHKHKAQTSDNMQRSNVCSALQQPAASCPCVYLLVCVKYVLYTCAMCKCVWCFSTGVKALVSVFTGIYYAISPAFIALILLATLSLVLTVLHLPQLLYSVCACTCERAVCVCVSGRDKVKKEVIVVLISSLLSSWLLCLVWRKNLATLRAM